MSRVKLQKDKQREFLNRVARYFDFNWPRVAKISNVCERSIRDWRKEKYNMSYEALLRLREISNIPVPKIVEILPEYWSAKKFACKGALRRHELYGNFGTPEGRRKGGINSQRLFRLNPEYARKLGVNIRKKIEEPKPSVELAEFIGIMLGDGGMSDYQINVTFNTETDSDYGIYVQKLIRKLFSISTFIVSRYPDKADRIVASSKNLIEFLQRKGLKIGNKIKHNVNIPQWVINNKIYSLACLRGLIDTDGSFYPYRHKVYKKIYCNFAMCFTNHSKPLLRNVCKILKDASFNPVMNNERVYLHRKNEIDRYFKEVGTNNLKHLQKYQSYTAIKGS